MFHNKLGEVKPVEITMIKHLLTACHEAKRITELMPALPQGMTARHVYALDAIRQLEQSGEPVRVSDISDYLQGTRPSVTKLIQELEALGVVRKFPDCRDKRVVLLELTPLGQQYYDFYVEQYQSRLAEQLGDLSPEDIQTTIATIHRFYQVVRSCKTEESKT